MKRSFLIFTGLFLSFFTLAKGDTTYFDWDWKMDPTVKVTKQGYYAIFEQEKGERSRVFYRFSSPSDIARTQEWPKGKDVIFEQGIPVFKGHHRKGRPVGVQEYFDVDQVLIYGEEYSFFNKKKREYYLKDGKQVYTIADRMSTFGKVRDELRSFEVMGKYISEHLKKPPVSEELAEPFVQTSFLISPEGKVMDIEILSSAHPGLNSAAIDVLEGMPAWLPAKANGIEVYSECMVTIVF